MYRLPIPVRDCPSNRFTTDPAIYASLFPYPSSPAPSFSDLANNRLAPIISLPIPSPPPPPPPQPPPVDDVRNEEEDRPVTRTVTRRHAEASLLLEFARSSTSSTASSSPSQDSSLASPPPAHQSIPARPTAEDAPPPSEPSSDHVPPPSPPLGPIFQREQASPSKKKARKVKPKSRKLKPKKQGPKKRRPGYVRPIVVRRQAIADRFLSLLHAAPRLDPPLLAPQDPRQARSFPFADHEARLDRCFGLKLIWPFPSPSSPCVGQKRKGGTGMKVKSPRRMNSADLDRLEQAMEEGKIGLALSDRILGKQPHHSGGKSCALPPARDPGFDRWSGVAICEDGRIVRSPPHPRFAVPVSEDPLSTETVTMVLSRTIAPPLTPSAGIETTIGTEIATTGGGGRPRRKTSKTSVSSQASVPFALSEYLVTDTDSSSSSSSSSSSESSDSSPEPSRPAFPSSFPPNAPSIAPDAPVHPHREQKKGKHSRRREKRRGRGKEEDGDWVPGCDDGWGGKRRRV